jgi:hypothetical protein
MAPREVHMREKKKTKNARPRRLTPATCVAGLTAAGAAAFLPGQAEAHCGHGMYGITHWIYWDEEGEQDWGCVGKGDQPLPSYDCVWWQWPGGCREYYTYYNCYEPC